MVLSCITIRDYISHPLDREGEWGKRNGDTCIGKYSRLRSRSARARTVRAAIEELSYRMIDDSIVRGFPCPRYDFVRAAHKKPGAIPKMGGIMEKFGVEDRSADAIPRRDFAACNPIVVEFGSLHHRISWWQTGGSGRIIWMIFKLNKVIEGGEKRSWLLHHPNSQNPSENAITRSFDGWKNVSRECVQVSRLHSAPPEGDKSVVNF